VSSLDLVNLAQMDGKMQWLAGYGNLSSEKAYRLATRAAIVSMILLPVWLGTRIMDDMEILNIGSGFFFMSFLLIMILPFPYVSLSSKKRALEKLQDKSWQYDPVKRVLTHWEGSEIVMEYTLSENDHLSAIRWRGDLYGEFFTLEYRRPYPAPYVRILTFIYSKPSDKKDFAAAAQNIAKQMNLPLDENGLYN
jgi:hypothetical protein